MIPFYRGLALAVFITMTAPDISGQSAKVTGVIVDSASGRSVANAIVLDTERGQRARSGPDGRYVLRVHTGSIRLRATRIGFRPAMQVVEVGAAQTVEQDFSLSPSAVPIDPIVSTGTRSRGRTATSSVAPVDVMTAEAMEASGLRETWEIVQRLVPSVNVTRVPLQDDQVRALTLRGLSPDHVLVLVNGKRRHSIAGVQNGPVTVGTSPVDINSIPLAAIERIEILRDGAAAQYGSDAIAGVVNVILKSGERSEAAASYGTTYTTEGDRRFRDGSRRSIAVTRGKTLPNGGGLSVTAQLRDQEPTNRAYPDPRQRYFPGDPRNDIPPTVAVNLGDTRARDLAVQLVVSYPLGEDFELYAASGGSWRDGLVPVSDFRLPMSENTVRSIHPDGYLPEIENLTSDYAGSLGGRGIFRGWRWDLSSSLGSNGLRYAVGNTNNVSLGDESPTHFFAGRLRFAQWTSSLDFSRHVSVGSGLPLIVAAGAEMRRDAYRIRAGEPDSWRDGGVPILDGPRAGLPAPVGAQGFVGFRPSEETDEGRTALGAYADLDANPVKSLRVSVAARAEHYTDFGGTQDGRFSARFEPAAGISLRSSVGTGFRAPSLIHSFFSTTRVARLLGAPDNGQVTVRTLPVASAEARLLGARSLRPERSLNVSSGIVFARPGFPTVTLDYYRVDIADRIILSGTFFDSTIARMFAERGFRGVGGGRYFTNGIDTKTRGIDLVATHGFLMRPDGRVRLTATYNRSETVITGVAAVPRELSAYQSHFFGRADSGRIEVAQPRSGGSIAAGWSGRRVSVDLHNRRFGRTVFVSPTPALDQTFSAKWITDFNASYGLRQRVRIAASVGNLFDVYPDEWRDFKDGLAGVMSAAGTVKHPAGFSPFGVNGRIIYLHLRYGET